MIVCSFLIRDRDRRGEKKIPWGAAGPHRSKRGAAADEHTRCTGPSLHPAKPNGLTGHDNADLRRRMPQLARAPASLRRPGAFGSRAGAVLRVSVSELRAQQHKQNRIPKSYPVTYTQCKAQK